MRALFLGLALLADGQDPARPPIAEEFDLPEDLEVTLWAESPLFYNPTNIDIDARGRVWVAEGVNYRGKQRGEGYLRHPEGDRIMVVEDSDGDGRADRSKVFAQDRDLVVPLGIAVLGGRAVVSCAPSIFIYADLDGDGRADRREVFLTGFQGKDSDHGLHAVVPGPDGRWYFNQGNHGSSEVRDRAGWTLRVGRRSDDGRVWFQAVTLRAEADGTGLRALAHNFRNPYETAVDSFGNVWQNDNDDDGNQSCRLAWVMEGGNYGRRSFDGSRAWQQDRRPGQSVQAAHWHEDDPGIAPPGDITGDGGPTGLAVYEGDLLPAAYRGMVLNADAGRGTVFGHAPRPEGAGFRYDRIRFLAARPGERSRLFRPSDVAVGPDGAVYVADWYDPVVGAGDMRDKAGYGRILRIAPRGRKPVVPKGDLSTLEGQLAALANPAPGVRYDALVKLRAQGEKARSGLEKLFAGSDPVLRARALWLLPREAKVRALADPDPAIRTAAFRALRQVEADVLPHAAALARDPSAAVRRELALALRDVPLQKCRELLVALAEGTGAEDRTLLEAVGIACGGKEEGIWPDLLSRLGHADPAKWSEAFERLAWRLRPAAAVPALAARAKAGSRLALEALAFTRHVEAARAMVELAASGPPEVRREALWWAKQRAENDWRTFGIADRLRDLSKDVSMPEPPARLEALKKALLEEGGKDREEAATALALDAEGGRWLLGLAAQGRLPKELEGAVAGAMFRNADFGVRGLAGDHFKRPARDGTFPPVDELARRKGSSANGKKVFFSASTGCGKCHLFAGEGGDVGPNLTEIRGKYGRPELLDSILNPSAAIAFGYDSWLVQTKGGEVYSGILLSDGEEILLKESSGEMRAIRDYQVAFRKQQKSSIMPDNIALGLTAQDLVDVVEFLLELPK